MAQPNLIVIMSDQHNPHVTGYAGNPWVRTPNLDRLAASGTVLRNAYCAAPLCVPSRMAFMTGQFPLDLRIWTNGGILPAATPTFAHALNAGGYETVLCGRMHFTGFDQNHGFRSRLVGDVSGAMTGVPEKGLTFENVWSQEGCGQRVGSLRDAAVGPGKATYEAYDEDVTARAVELLTTWGREGREQPFCLVIGLLLPHNPYVCRQALFDEYMDTLPQTIAWEDSTPDHPAVRSLKATRGADEITEDMARRARAAYYGLVTTLDESIGRILNALSDAGFQDSTHVVYTSDHGDLCGEHGLWWKDSFYDGSVNVPLLWSCPGTVREGAVEDGVVSLLDIAPTLTDLAEAPSLPAARGDSLAPLLLVDAGKETPWRDSAYAETCALGERPARMLRQGRFKLCVYHGYDDVQLFDLAEDPQEHTDLGKDPEYEGVRERMLREITRDWDGEMVECKVRQQDGARRLLFRQGGLCTPAVSERWIFPAGQNRRA